MTQHSAASGASLRNRKSASFRKGRYLNDVCSERARGGPKQQMKGWLVACKVIAAFGRNAGSLKNRSHILLSICRRPFRAIPVLQRHNTRMTMKGLQGDIRMWDLFCYDPAFLVNTAITLVAWLCQLQGRGSSNPKILQTSFKYGHVGGATPIWRSPRKERVCQLSVGSGSVAQ